MASDLRLAMLTRGESKGSETFIWNAVFSTEEIFALKSHPEMLAAGYFH